MFAWLPYYTCHQNLPHRIGLFSAQRSHAITRIIATGEQQSTTMTGHKDGSHKKRKITRLQTTDEKRSAKKLRDSEPPDVETTVVAVTQTQDADADAEPDPVPITTPHTSIVATPGSPVADNDAIAAISEVAAHPVRDLEGMAYAKRRLDTFKNKVKSKNAMKLTSSNVFPWIRDSIVQVLENDLKTQSRAVSSSSAVIKKANSFFHTVAYNRVPKPKPGQSARIAQRNHDSVAVPVTPDIIKEVDLPVFNAKVAKKAAPGIDWNRVSPTFNLDSRKLRRYIVEDVMFANPETHERLLILVSPTFPSFASTWLPIFTQQSSMRPPVMFDKTMFFQIEASTVKNAKRKDFVDGMVTQSDVRYLLTKEGGGGIGLHFPGCDRSFDIELKFATVLDETSSFQVWGASRAGRDLHRVFLNLRVQAKRELYYSCFLSESTGFVSCTSLS
jgi:hypothetical protein